MADLRVAIYSAAPIPMATGGVWQPMSCTLIYSSKEAVLVDTPVTTQQTIDLIAWIERTAPGRTLSYIYITHGHGDHWFGLTQLVARFPSAVPLATARTIQHMHQQIEPAVFAEMWESRFPGQIQRPFTIAKEISADGKFALDDGRWGFEAITVGHSDMDDTTVLWVPELRLAVCGDVVYGQVHQWLFESATKAQREAWIRAIEKVEALNPAYVVGCHSLAEEVPGVWHLAATKKYIQDYESIVASGKVKSADELVKEMLKIYPDRFNPWILELSAGSAFAAT
ncbi:beta-lactamase-like protein [Favolaschia claudopus]|uniref:Beta-lactamase-like protein n=1 Tax=Favolaschia claudopus TaxID=2862362 RepID=A0AAW0D7F4_9AGAR